MHVLIIPSWYITPELPDSGIFFREKALALAKAGVNTGVVYVDVSAAFWRIKLRKGRFWCWQKKRDTAGIQTLRLDGLGLPITWPLGFWIYQKMVQKLIDRYKEEFGRPDVIHTHGFWAAAACKGRDVPVVYTEHLTFVQEQRLSDFQVRLLQEATNQSALVTAVGTALAHSLNALTDAQVKVIPNLVDTVLFSPGTRPELFTFVVVGDLIPRKLPLIILEAFKNIREKQTIKLKFVGEGPMRKELEHHCRDHGLWSDVEFCGRLSKEGVVHQLQQSSCLIMCSETETFGVAIIEAMSCGLPVIASCCGGPVDIVTDATGILIPAGDSDALENAMEVMIRDQKNYLPEIIRNYVLGHFDHQLIAEKWMMEYKKIIS